MIEERLKYARTGHRDCCGDMIRRRDTVITRDGVGVVVWACRKWWIRYQGRPADALNKYPAAELRRVTEDVTVGTVPTCDNNPLSQESIVTGQRNDCHEHCHGIVQSVKYSQSVGYINNVTK